MHMIDYTHPQRVPHMHLAHDRRGTIYYLRLDELPQWHPYYYKDWILFRYSEWLEGGSAWVHAKTIVEDMEAYIQQNNLRGEIKPVVGSNDPAYDEGLAQAIRTFGYFPLVAELVEKQPFENAGAPINQKEDGAGAFNSASSAGDSP